MTTFWVNCSKSVHTYFGWNGQ